MAEAVRGRDRGCVETGQSICQPLSPWCHRLGATLGDHLEHHVVSSWFLTGVQQPAKTSLSRYQSFPHAVSQFAGGHPGEGDGQDLGQCHYPLGHQPGHQRRDGEGFAGARAGLQDGHPRPW